MKKKDMPNNGDGNYSPENAKVLKLGLNISVSGDPGTDFEIVLDDKEQKAGQSSSLREEQRQSLDALELDGFTTDVLKHEIEKPDKQEVAHAQSTGAIPKHKPQQYLSELSKLNDLEDAGNSASNETNLINRIKTTMEHFEKFSDRVKEIPRLRNHPLATSTPFSDKYNSRSESSLVYAESRPKKLSHHYDYSRREYFKSSFKPSPPDLFLKPLPAEGYYKRGIYTKYFDYFDLEPYRHYGSDNNLNKSSEFKSAYVKSNYDYDKYEEPPSSILKKSDNESGDKQSTSSAESIKDIKIYQSGGILIMQNFKENLDMTEKKEISEFSAKLIENCNRLKMETIAFQEDKPAFCSFSGENKNSVKMVQFDLPDLEGQRSKSSDLSFNATKDESSLRMESSASTCDYVKNKDSSPQNTSQNQDFPSISTQENDSIMSNPPGMSPTYPSSKKLEWDSGADIGYLDLDLTKENLSTIEKIVLKGLSSDGTSEKNVVYEKKPEQNQPKRSKFILERMPSDLVVEEFVDVDVKSKETSDDKKEQEKKGKSRSNSEHGSERKAADRKNHSKIDCKGKIHSKLEETKPSFNKNPATKPNKSHTKELTDKSVNINTLFENETWKIFNQSVPKEIVRPSESSVKSTYKRASLSPKIKTLRNKSKSSPKRLLKVSKKSKADVKPPLFTYLGMGSPKKVYRKVEATPTLNDFELSREVDEIIIDQRFKIKQNVASGPEKTKETEISAKDKVENSKEVKIKSRPISASSSSNNTVLPKSEHEEKTKRAEDKFTDQIIQTSDYECQSVGIQAFASQISSEWDFKSVRKNSSKPTERAAERECVNTSSKNIQAFGLNCSLPKQLEHPRSAEVLDSQHTKSTQYFGGPLNSLPNYHCNLVTKRGESCSRAPNVLKSKKSSETEVIRVKEQNEKNILANDSPKSVDNKKDSKRLSNIENKENLISKKSTNSKKSHSNSTRKHDSEKTNTKGKKKIPVDGADTCDDVSSLVLTTENLKEHGGSIDRNIIQEKYFQSQLVELEKKKMISRSTSMEIQLQTEDDGKEYISTGCQYSPQSRRAVGEVHEDDSSEGNAYKKTRKKPPLEQLLSKYICQNTEEEAFETPKSTNQEQTGDSLPSSTQTARSWVPGVQNFRKNSNGVGKARSFEYLPGHIYESSVNLKELPSETEQNLITSSSDSDTAKGSVSNRGDSEGRTTLILENSTEHSHSTDRMKILDENLTQLNFAVLKLWEKDAQVQSITRSLLEKLCMKGGSGDWLPLGVMKVPKAEVGEGKDPTDNGKAGDTPSEVSAQMPKDKEKEFSVACQTERKSPSSDPEKFLEEKKALEKRISEEKRYQIKWIENEIQQLNVLRELLEKQSSSVQRKKKHSFLSLTSNETSKSGENYSKNTSMEIYPRPVTPVYGCTISVIENVPPENNQPPSDVNQQSRPCPSQYGMSVSLSGRSNNLRHVVMLPVGIQVSLRESSPTGECNNEEMNKENLPRLPCRSPLKSNLMMGSQTHASTQYPSIRKPSGISAQTDFPSPTKSNQSNKDNCFCINLSEKTFSSTSRSKVSDRRGSSRLCFIDEESDTENENPTGNLTGECLETDNCVIPRQVREEKINVDCSSDLSLNSAKSKPSQIKSCKCQRCVKSASPTVGKSYQGPHESNFYLNCCSKTSEDLRGCRCSRVKVQKSSHCSCHVIKIHGPKCCSSERSPCSCKRRNQDQSKKTENQSCQTDSAEDITKDLTKYPEITKQAEAPEVKQSFAAKVAVERKNAIQKKLLCSPKVSYEREEPCEVDLFVMEKRGYVKQTSRDISVRNCNCRRKAEKEKPEEHPRHYFLRIEETEVEECANEPHQKKSLEVITVKVPFKKAGKGKIYCGDVQQPYDNTRKLNLKSSEEPSNGCKCCASCADNCRRLEQNNNPHFSPCYRTQAERPESPPVRVSRSSHESVSRSYLDPHLSRDSNPRSELTYPPTPVNDPRESQCCEECNCMHKSSPPSRDVQNEYDSHKKRKGSNAKNCYVEGNANYHEDRRAPVQSGKQNCYDEGGNLHEWDLNFKEPRAQALNGNVEQYNPDYYNYNKREFMTKSEIMKEERQKVEVRQPTLQECLSGNRPDFYSNAERRRQIISERTKERVKRHNDRMECLMKMVKHCSGNEQFSNTGSKRIFTTAQMREQTLRKYKKLPEVTEKIADEKKKSEYKTNRIMADIFAKKLQIEALKGHINLSNSVSVLYTI